jgi:hypothetical protein
MSTAVDLSNGGRTEMPTEAKAQAAAPVHYDQTLQITAFLLALGMAMISSPALSWPRLNIMILTFHKTAGNVCHPGLNSLF